MKKTLITALLLCSTFAFADNTELNTAQDYCASKGGEKISSVSIYDVGNRQQGVTKTLCQFKTGPDKKVLAYVALDTLRTEQPTIATTYMKKLVIDKTKNLPSKPFFNPSLNVCQRLGGGSIAFVVGSGGFVDKNKNELDICVFGDGSSISAWSLIYLAESTPDDPDRTLLLNAINTKKTLDIDMPNITER